MRQRVLIAAAFALEPTLIVADEPTTALDVTVQKQILRLIRNMQSAHGTAVIFVTHDLGVVAQICDDVTLLFGGRVVEDGAASQTARAAARIPIRGRCSKPARATTARTRACARFRRKRDRATVADRPERRDAMSGDLLIAGTSEVAFGAGRACSACAKSARQGAARRHHPHRSRRDGRHCRRKRFGQDDAWGAPCCASSTSRRGRIRVRRAGHHQVAGGRDASAAAAHAAHLSGSDGLPQSAPHDPAHRSGADAVSPRRDERSRRGGAGADDLRPVQPATRLPRALSARAFRRPAPARRHRARRAARAGFRAGRRDRLRARRLDAGAGA